MYNVLNTLEAVTASERILPSNRPSLGHTAPFMVGASVGRLSIISAKIPGEILRIVLCDPLTCRKHKLVANKLASSEKSIDACWDAVCESAAWRTTVQTRGSE